jgi:hypothetical protein
MTVKITKPEINIREKLAELDKPTSIAGEAMIRAETPQEQQALIGAAPNRNLIINGDFQVWQRGTTGTSGYVADRWDGNNCSSQSKQYDAEVGNYLQFTATNAAIMYYGIELNETGKSAPFELGETYTISLKVKSTAVMYKPNVSFRDNLSFGTNTVFNSIEIKPHKGTGEWEDVVYQFTVTSLPHGTAPLFELTLVSFDYSNTQINIAQVQMVKGKVATPFEHRSYGEELALCQRYGCRLGADPADSTAHYNLIGSGWWRNTTSVPYNLQIQAVPPVPLRHKDYTASVIGTNQFYIQSGSQVGTATFYSINNPGSSPTMIWLDFTASTAAATNGQAAAVASNNNPAYNNAIFIDAEF